MLFSLPIQSIFGRILCWVSNVLRKMKDTPLEWWWYTATRWRLCDELICNITHLAVSLCSRSKTDLFVLTPGIQFTGKYKAKSSLVFFPDHLARSCVHFCPWRHKTSLDQYWEVLRCLHHYHSCYLKYLNIFLKIEFIAFQNINKSIIKGGLLDRCHCNEDKITCATLIISYGILCIYPRSKSTLHFSSVPLKACVQAKGTYSKCMFPSLLKISCYWVNTHSDQKSIKSCASCMPKVTHILQSFLNWSLGLDTTVCRVPETNCVCWDLLLIFILWVQAPRLCCTSSEERWGAFLLLLPYSQQG